MELQKFISESLKQICFGIRDARDQVSDEIGNYPIAPASFNGKPVSGEQENITFDIAVTVSQDNKLNASGGIGIGSVGIGAKGELSNKEENIHRINFKVPFYPQALNNKFKTKN